MQLTNWVYETESERYVVKVCVCLLHVA